MVSQSVMIVISYFAVSPELNLTVGTPFFTGSWPHSGEIDILETVGHAGDTFYGTVHTSAYNHAKGTQKGGWLIKTKSEWHIFEIDWQVDKIRFAIDNQIYYSFANEGMWDKWPFDQDFHILMNVAVGGGWGGAQGVDGAAFEGDGQFMEVDWVRVYVANCGCPQCTATVWNTPVTDSGGTYSCGSRITWLQTSTGGGLSERDACIRVSNEFPSGPCGQYCDPTKCNTGERICFNEVKFLTFLGCLI